MVYRIRDSTIRCLGPWALLDATKTIKPLHKPFAENWDFTDMTRSIIIADDDNKDCHPFISSLAISYGVHFRLRPFRIIPRWDNLTAAFVIFFSRFYTLYPFLLPFATNRHRDNFTCVNKRSWNRMLQQKGTAKCQRAIHKKEPEKVATVRTNLQVGWLVNTFSLYSTVLQCDWGSEHSSIKFTCWIKAYTVHTPIFGIELKVEMKLLPKQAAALEIVLLRTVSIEVDDCPMTMPCLGWSDLCYRYTTAISSPVGVGGEVCQLTHRAALRTFSEQRRRKQSVKSQMAAEGHELRVAHE